MTFDGAAPTPGRPPDGVLETMRGSTRYLMPADFPSGLFASALTSQTNKWSGSVFG
jgi:hypothetical protein